MVTPNNDICMKTYQQIYTIYICTYNRFTKCKPFINIIFKINGEL